MLKRSVSICKKVEKKLHVINFTRWNEKHIMLNIINETQ